MAVTEGQDGYAGQQGITSGTSQYNALRFVIFQALGEVSTIKIVKVKAVDAETETVDVQPMVDLMDGAKNTIPQGTIFGIPYAKLQAGTNQIVMTPRVGDIGVMACADRDISAVKAARDQANPGSFRRFHPSDGIYLMALFGEDPDQSIEFTETGIEIEDKNGNSIVMGPDGVNINGVTIDQSGNVVTLGNVISGPTGISSTTHTHTSGAPGFPTGPPLP